MRQKIDKNVKGKKKKNEIVLFEFKLLGLNERVYSSNKEFSAKPKS